MKACERFKIFKPCKLPGREKRSASYIVSLVCFTPNLITGILLVVDSSRLPTLVAYNSSSFLILLNSSLNPLVYCWRYREIRNIVKNTVKKMFLNNQEAH